MQLRILCVHIEISSLWAEFVNKNRCISVRLVSEKVKIIKFWLSHNRFLCPEYFIDFLCERWIPCQSLTSVLCLHYRPETGNCNTKKGVHLLNKFPCIITLGKTEVREYTPCQCTITRVCFRNGGSHEITSTVPLTMTKSGRFFRQNIIFIFECFWFKII